MAKPKLNIIGAGPVGLSCGILALNNGFAVTIFSENLNENPRIAGLVAGGMLAPAYECLCQSDDDFSDFAFESRRLWNDLADKCGIEIVPNALSLAQTKGEYEFLERQISAAKGLGFDFEFVAAPDGLNANHALWLKSDGLLNPVIAHDKLLKTFVDLGGEIIFDLIREINDKSLSSNTQEYEFDRLIIASGFASIEFAKFIPELSYLRPTHGQVIEIDKAPIFNGSMRYKTTYIMARSGNIVIGATSNNIDSWETSDEETAALFNSACELIPSIADSKIIAKKAGIRPNTIDEMPILGQSSRENIFLAIGAYRNGWLLAPKIADYVIKSLENDIQKYSYRRFK